MLCQCLFVDNFIMNYPAPKGRGIPFDKLRGKFFLRLHSCGKTAGYILPQNKKSPAKEFKEISRRVTFLLKKGDFMSRNTNQRVYRQFYIYLLPPSATQHHLD